MTKLCGNMCYVFIGAITVTLAFRHAGEQQQSRKSDLLMNADSTFKRLTSDILNLKKWRGSPWGFGRRRWPPRWFGARESEPRRSLRDWPARRWALRGTPRQNEPGMNRGAQIWGCGVLAKWGEEGEERVGGKKKKEGRQQQHMTHKHGHSGAERNTNWLFIGSTENIRPNMISNISQTFKMSFFDIVLKFNHTSSTPFTSFLWGRVLHLSLLQNKQKKKPNLE